MSPGLVQRRGKGPGEGTSSKKTATGTHQLVRAAAQESLSGAGDHVEEAQGGRGGRQVKGLAGTQSQQTGGGGSRQVVEETGRQVKETDRQRRIRQLEEGIRKVEEEDGQLWGMRWIDRHTVKPNSTSY